MKSIGFKNFRKFTDFSSMDFGGVTLMVGRNNSGKSTLVKAVLIALDFIKNNTMQIAVKPSINFDMNVFYDTNVGTFVRALNNKADSSEISFDITTSDYRFGFSIIGDKNDKNTTIADVSKVTIYDIKRNVNFVFDLMANLTSVAFGAVDSKSEVVSLINKTTEEIKDLKIKLKTAEDIASIDDLQSQIKSYEKNLKALRQDLSNQEEESIEFDLNFNIDLPNSNLISSLLRSVMRYHRMPSNYTDKRSKEYKSDFHSKNVLREKDQIIEDVHMGILSFVNNVSVEYIPAFDIKKTIYFSSKDSSDYIADTIHSYYKIRHNKSAENFVLKWMTIMGIGSNFEIESLGGEVHKLSIVDNGNGIVSLADKGTGSIRLMILIMRLAIIIAKYGTYNIKPLIFVEEPELNLHPNLQSQLAALFESIYVEYNIKFIIETHSEYMIRKSQVLVASKGYKDEEDLRNNPFAVYYFHLEDIPYRMKYRTDGKFSNEFGKGFFDEASNLAFEIF